MKSTSPQCVKCPVVRCQTLEKDKKLPNFCPTKSYPDITKQSVDINKTDPEIKAINLAFFELMDRVNKDRYKWTRLDEIIEYAKIRKVKKIGIGFCVGLMYEAKLLTEVLEAHGFEVISVSCLAGEVAPKEVDILRDGAFCNPIMQAEVLNREDTELNIMLGLCLGHDILFLRHSKADVTPLVVKDRSTGHNPVAAIYLSAGYYKDRFFAKSS